VPKFIVEFCYSNSRRLMICHGLPPWQVASVGDSALATDNEAAHGH